MSIIRAIKHRLGLSVTPANNFTLDASADNGTMKLARESGQDIMTVDAAGKVKFPQLPSSLNSPTGFINLPGGVLIQWGSASGGSTAGEQTITLPTPFADVNYQVIGGSNDPLAATVFSVACGQLATTFFKARTSAASPPYIRWIAIGKAPA